MTIDIVAPDYRILARIINLTARMGCAVKACALVHDEAGECRISVSFTGETVPLSRLTAQLQRLALDEAAVAVIA